MQRYTISSDGQRVVFTGVDEKGRTPVWLATLNGRTQPRRLTTMDCWDAYFGAPGEVVFEGDEKGTPSFFAINEDGSELQKNDPNAIPHLAGRLAGRATGWRPRIPAPGARWRFIRREAVLLRESATVAQCPRAPIRCLPSMKWTPDGRFVYLKFESSTYAIPLQPGQLLPPIPASGFASKEAVAALPGARLVSERDVYPGPNPSIYAFVKVSAQRNIYRVPVP